MRLSVTCVLALAACGGGTPSIPGPPSDAGPALVVHVPSRPPAVVDAEAARSIDAASLQAELYVDGPPGAVPEAVLVSLARPVWTHDEVSGATVDGLDVSWSGRPVSASWDDDHTLRLVPDAPLTPGQSTTVTVSAVPTRDGTKRLPAPVSIPVAAPAFGLDRVTLTSRAWPGGAAVLDLWFTAPVDPEGAEAALSVRTPEGAVVRTDGFTFVSPLQARLTAHPSTPARTLVVEVGSGLNDAAGTAAQVTTRRVTLPTEPSGSMAVLALRLVASGSGHAIDVVCDDRAATGSRQYVWDSERDESWVVSRRCELSPEEVAAHVHTWPPLELMPSGTRTGFRLTGALPRGPLHVRLDAGTTTIDGGQLPRPVEATLQVPMLDPTLQLLASGRYLPRDAWRTIGLRHRNTDHASLRVRHVPAVNLPFWMSSDDETATARVSDLVVDTEVPLPLERDVTSTSWLALGDVLPTPEAGVYEVSVDAGEASDHARVVVTDLEVIAKQGHVDGRAAWDAWVLDLHDHTPTPGALVRLVRASGAEVDRCTTDAAGRCRVAVPADEVDPAPPVALLAGKDGDLTYLRFDDVRVQTSEAVVQGVSWQDAPAYLASAWTERGVYRPGETVHLAAVLRDGDHRAPPADLPVRVDVRDPRGKITRRLTLHPDATGLVTADVALAASATTGTWEALVVVGDATIGRTRFAAEDFVPERMEVTATVTADDLAASDAAVVAVDARYLFGGSAAGAPVEVGCRLEPDTFTPPTNAQLHVGPSQVDDGAVHVLELARVSAELDDAGHADVTCPGLSDADAISGPMRLVADVAVFEAGSGRSTHAVAHARVHPERYYLGLDAGVTEAEIDTPVTVTGQVIDWTGQRVTDALDHVTVDLLHVETEWGWFADDDTGASSYRTTRRLVNDGTLTVPVEGGRFTIRATPHTPGPAFVIRARAGGTTSDLSLDLGGSWWWWSEETTTDRTPRPLAPTAIAVDAPERIRVDAPVTVSFDAPFAGRALLTVETDALLASTWKDVTAGPNQWTFTVDDVVPNVYVGVLLLKDPHLESAESFLPDRAWGTRSVAVEPTEHLTEVTLDLPEEVRSEGTLTVKVDAGATAANGRVTLAAVDEGILSLTRYQAPDPLPDLFPRHALEVDTYETVGWNVARPGAGPSRAIGGDADSMPVRITGVEPVSLWSGPVDLDASGRATVTLEVPDYRGALKVMAVVTTPSRTGAAQGRVLVRDPLVVQTTVPRVMVHGDRAEIPVFVTNASGAPQDVQLSMALGTVALGGFAASDTSPLVFEGGTSTTLHLDDGASQTAVFRLRAEASYGGGEIRVTATSGALTSTQRLVVPIVPDAPREHRVERFTLQDGALTLASHLEGWVPTTDRTTVWVTGNPYAEALSHLRYLAHYPYGCIEQTTSTTRPLLVLDDVVPGVVPEATGKGSLDDMVRSGLERVLSMQTSTGGFGYWPGASTPTLWGSAYATHLLLDARDGGYDVPAEAVDDALDWLDGELEASTGSVDTRTDDARRSWPYVHYVLARAGRRHTALARSQLAALATDDGREVTEARYLLQATLYLSGDHRYEAALRHPDARPISATRRNDWTFWSDLRGRGLMLSTFHDLFGKDVDGSAEPLARAVADALSTHTSRWYTTQELVWGVTGLGKRVHGNSRSAIVTLSDGDRALAPVDLEGGDQRWTITRAAERPALTLDVSGKGSGDLFALIDVEGVREDAAWRVGGEGLALTRAFVDADGHTVDPTSLPLGALVFAVTTVRNTTASPVTNLALVDRYPAGWEIENPRLGRGAQLSWMSTYDLWEPAHVDVRDDRVEVFGDLPSRADRVIVVGLRATTAGTFTMPPSDVEAMYDGTIWARVPPRRVEVVGSWERSWL